MRLNIPIRLRRFAFWFYALGVFTSTHWPRLEINVPGFERPDLFLHFSVFGTWCFLLYATEYLGPLNRYKTVAKAWVIAALVSCADEALQIPEFVHRHAAWDDLAADVGGVTLGAIAALVCASFCRRAAVRRGQTV